MEFYFADGWNGTANFQCRSSAGGVHMILIKQSIKRHLTRVTKFEEAQSNNKAHMCKCLYHEDRHMALVGQTRGVIKLWRFSS